MKYIISYEKLEKVTELLNWYNGAEILILGSAGMVALIKKWKK